jgi:hypothetical protein
MTSMPEAGQGKVTLKRNFSLAQAGVGTPIFTEFPA